MAAVRGRSGTGEGSKGTRFRPGHRGDGREKGAERMKKERVPEMLRQMRWVFKTKEGNDRREWQKRLREWMATDLKGFLGRLAQLESDWLKVRVKREEAGEGATAGEDKALGELERWARANGYGPKEAVPAAAGGEGKAP